MKGKWIIIKVILGLLVLGFLLSFSAHRHACKTIKDIHIKIDHESGKYFLNDSLINQIISNRQLDVKKIPLGNLNIGEIENKLDENPFVQKAEVYKDVDGALFINVMQQEPIARIHTGNDEYYLTADLNKMPLSNLYASEVILIGGKIEEEDYPGIKEIVSYIMADKLLKKHIIAIKKLRPNSFILLVNKGNYYIEFGPLDNIENKFENLKLFYNQYLGRVGLDYYQSINLKFNNQIVATKRNSDEQ